jgi:hypothetical protein
MYNEPASWHRLSTTALKTLVVSLALIVLEGRTILIFE